MVSWRSLHFVCLFLCSIHLTKAGCDDYFKSISKFLSPNTKLTFDNLTQDISLIALPTFKEIVFCTLEKEADIWGLSHVVRCNKDRPSCEHQNLLPERVPFLDFICLVATAFNKTMNGCLHDVANKLLLRFGLITAAAAATTETTTATPTTPTTTATTPTTTATTPTTTATTPTTPTTTATPTTPTTTATTPTTPTTTATTPTTTATTPTTTAATTTTTAPTPTIPTKATTFPVSMSTSTPTENASNPSSPQKTSGSPLVVTNSIAYTMLGLSLIANMLLVFFVRKRHRTSESEKSHLSQNNGHLRDDLHLIEMNHNYKQTSDHEQHDMDLSTSCEE